MPLRLFLIDLDRQPVIVSAARTPIGKFLGSLAALQAPELGAAAIRAALQRAKVPAEEIEEVILGNVIQGGVGQAPARQALMKSGIPSSVSALTINKVCGSGLKAVMLAAQSIDGNSSLGNSSLVYQFGFWAGAAIPIGLAGRRLQSTSRLQARP